MAQGPYDHPNYQARRYITSPIIGGAATTTYGGHPLPFAGKIRRVTFAVVVAGTVTGHSIAIYNGTASVGVVQLGTGVARSQGTSADLASTFSAGGRLSYVTLADATGTAFATAEIEMTPDATWT